MAEFMALLAVIAAALMLLEHFSYKFTHDAVKRRYASGDKSCGVQKTWWGWRVREYGEGILPNNPPLARVLIAARGEWIEISSVCEIKAKSIYGANWLRQPTIYERAAVLQQLVPGGIIVEGWR